MGPHFLLLTLFLSLPAHAKMNHTQMQDTRSLKTISEEDHQALQELVNIPGMHVMTQKWKEQRKRISDAHNSGDYSQLSVEDISSELGNLSFQYSVTGRQGGDTTQVEERKQRLLNELANRGNYQNLATYLVLQVEGRLKDKLNEATASGDKEEIKKISAQLAEASKLGNAFRREHAALNHGNFSGYSNQELQQIKQTLQTMINEEQKSDKIWGNGKPGYRTKQLQKNMKKLIAILNGEPAGSPNNPHQMTSEEAHAFAMEGNSFVTMALQEMGYHIDALTVEIVPNYNRPNQTHQNAGTTTPAPPGFFSTNKALYPSPKDRKPASQSESKKSDSATKNSPETSSNAPTEGTSPQIDHLMDHSFQLLDSVISSGSSQ